MPCASFQVGTRRLEYEGTAKTRVFLVLGHPIAHSLSPVFQGAALHALALDAVFLAADIAPPGLPRAMADLRSAAAAGRLGGVSVTLPHKRTVLPFMDSLDDTARLAGAVNTIVCTKAAGAAQERPTFGGANTDVEGLRRSLDDACVCLRERPAVVLGTGGMAGAAVVAALRAGAAEVRVLGRVAARAEALTTAVSAAWSGPLPRFVHGPLTPPPAGILDDAAVLVQATSLGLRELDGSPLELVHAPPGLFVFETIYNPAETPLLRAARAAGLACRNGLGMLVHQGACALLLWTGQAPPVEVMRRSVGLP